MSSEHSYDAVPYRSLPLPQTHPSRLAAVGHLFAMTPVDPARARILEIGCGDGTNLISMAVTLPDAQFTGFDLSKVQIDKGRALIEQTGTTNVSLLQLDLDAADEALGEFDYIIAHGVFSWISRDLQDRLLALCAQRLAPLGIAYVSYNTLPGWHTRAVARDLMRYHALQFDTPQAQALQARAALDFLASENTAGVTAYAAERDRIASQPDSYVLHEHLAGHNSALYFHEFVMRAEAQGLKYLSEVELNTMMADAFAPHVRDTLARVASDQVRTEQLMDFLRDRSFRQTLLVRAEVAMSRRIEPKQVRALSFSGELRSVPAGDTGVSFVGANGAGVTTAHPITIAVLEAIATGYPRSLGFEDLIRRAGEIARPFSPSLSAQEYDTVAIDLTRCVILGLIEAHYQAFPCIERAGEFPCTSTLARTQATTGSLVSSLRHEAVELQGPLPKVLALLDGSRSRRDLLGQVAGIDDAAALDDVLKRLAASALLAA